MMSREPAVWSCRDEERMTSTTLDEAVGAHLDELCEPGEDNETIFREAGEITVTGFAPVELNRKCIAEMALDHVLKVLDEDYADPDLSGHSPTEEMKEASLVV